MIVNCPNCQTECYRHHYKNYTETACPKCGPIIEAVTNPMSDTTKKLSEGERITYGSVRREFLKQNPCCVVCLEVFGEVYSSSNVHHKRSRKTHLMDVAVFLAVCRKCERWIHTHEEESLKRGYLLEHIRPVGDRLRGQIRNQLRHATDSQLQRIVEILKETK